VPSCVGATASSKGVYLRKVTVSSTMGPGVPVDQVNPADEIAKFVGEHIPHEVLVANPWSPHLLVADAYRRG
jgi:hypothetical protein